MEKFDIKDRKGKAHSKEVQSLKAYMNGVKYLLVARCSGSDYLELKSYEYRNFKVSLDPATDANYAFSCEMFLKSIILYNEGDARGHNLKKLYDELPNKIKVEIKSQKMFSKDLLQIEFEELLEMMGDSFVFFRYDNENSGYTTNKNFLRFLSEFLELISYELIKPKRALY